MRILTGSLGLLCLIAVPCKVIHAQGDSLARHSERRGGRPAQLLLSAVHANGQYTWMAISTSQYGPVLIPSRIFDSRSLPKERRQPSARRGAFVFRTNPNGAMRDAQFSGVDNLNENWNRIWDVAVSRDSLGWTAEFRIAFQTLRFDAGPGASFGFNVERFIRRENEETFWQSWRRTQHFISSRPRASLSGLEYSRERTRSSCRVRVVARDQSGPLTLWVRKPVVDRLVARLV